MDENKTLIASVKMTPNKVFFLVMLLDENVALKVDKTNESLS